MSRRILILGASGMLGNAMLRVLSTQPDLDVTGTVRGSGALRRLPQALHEKVVCGVDVEQHDALVDLFERTRPQAVINCIGLVKQLAAADDPLSAVPINTLLPHRLSRLCRLTGARLVHFSTDCVFSGRKGGYIESDQPDADDLYGRSKLLGEVHDPHAITLRTSIIGHELEGQRSLVGWFLAQQGSVRGFTHAIFSGLPTAEVARVVMERILPRPELHGLYHLSAEPIDKYSLLTLIAKVYGKQIDIVPDDALRIDRSLDSTRLREATGYAPAPWPKLIELMHQVG